MMTCGLTFEQNYLLSQIREQNFAELTAIFLIRQRRRLFIQQFMRAKMSPALIRKTVRFYLPLNVGKIINIARMWGQI